MAAGAGPTNSLPQRMRVAVEAAGTLGVDKTGTLANFIDVPFAEGTAQLTLTQETHNPQQALQDIRDNQVEVLGKKSWSLVFNIPLYSSGVPATQGQAATGGALGRLLKALMGGEHKGQGTIVATGGWANSATGDVATGAGLLAGGLFHHLDSDRLSVQVYGRGERTEHLLLR